MTERDRDILRWLHRYRYLRQDHLIRILSPKSPKRFIERLGDLFHETGFINRPQIQAPLFDARATPMLYEISPKGTRYLDELGQLPSRAVTFSTRRRNSFSPQFLHTMMIIDTLLDTELESIATPHRTFMPVDDILARAPETTRNARNPLALPIRINGQASKIIPDALYGIAHTEQTPTGYRFIALECERTSPRHRNTGTASSTSKKQIAYAELQRTKAFTSLWGIPNLELRVVTSEKDRAPKNGR
ncbi:replication-relaxation family protein [Yoonia sp. I 8.24]|uniref:replication-relaxation family protein n=1 Tax=Yoonia sp. I 8.24 TaxID=1537229 RepID=UPI001EDE3627|nr:replication-relaxation family protein [Yoonia sp. I 8.24]MCG3267136.1 replication-relaxation family protein [Yoonia sp. I 8.24]